MTNPFIIQSSDVIRFIWANQIVWRTVGSVRTQPRHTAIHVSSPGVTPMLRQSDDMNILKSIEAPRLTAPTGMRWTEQSTLKLSPSPISVYKSQISMDLNTDETGQPNITSPHTNSNIMVYYIGIGHVWLAMAGYI